MAVTFTPQQQQVIDLRERNILVSAAAGSGKTAVLVERIIQMISDEEKKVDIDRLLVVTFTNAAAAEMRERISLAIDAKLQGQPENEHLQRQAALLHNAQITTIDSFCLFVIRNNFNDIGLDPGFRVADEGELRLLKQDVLSELLEQKYELGEEAFLSCTEYFTGGSNDKLLEEYIFKLYEFCMSYPWPEEWLAQRRNDYNITSVTEMEESEWCRYLTDYLCLSLKECAMLLKKARGLAEMPEGPYYYGELLEQEEEMIQKVGKASSFSALYEAIESISFGRLPGKKDESVSEELKKQVQALRNQVKKKIDELKTDYLLLSPEQVIARMQQAKEPVHQLLELVTEFKRLFDEKKRQENVIDFGDMEHFALNILLKKKEDGSCEATAAAKEYRQFFYEILIDEYQDSNLVQELLLQSISGEDEGRFNRFMVGDVKQSIYKFRLARPELFIEKYTCYEKVDSLRQRIDLHKNFRSRPEVLESVNDLFRQIMYKELGGVEYDNDAALYPGAEFPPYEHSRTEALIIGKMPESSLSAHEQEALALAQRIKLIVKEFLVTDKESGKLRPAQYRDIVILLRTTTGWAEDFKQIFEKEGIPAYVASRTGYFKAPEIRELLQLLHVIDNPFQDIPLYGVMHSFFGGFTDEEIALIRSRGEKGSGLYENLKTMADTIIEDSCESGPEETLIVKVREFLAFIKKLRYQASYTPIHTLIQNVLTDTGYLEYVSAKPGGEQRHANVEMLLTKAAAFEKTSYYGLFHFLRYMKQLEKYQVDYGEADIAEENADVVRIMSIHKSKGLEFPICFIAGLSKRFNRQDTAGRLIADPDMGIGVDYIDSRLRLQSKTLRKNAVAMKMKLDSLGEEIRVLYVAMTRAREKLFLSALVNDIDKWKENWEGSVTVKEDASKRLSFSALSGASCFLDVIAPCMNEFTWLYPEDIVQNEVEKAMGNAALLQKLRIEKADENFVTELSHKFERTYAHQYLSELLVKTTVSELKKAAYALPKEEADAFSGELFEEPEIVPYIPAFVKEKEGMSGTDRGSAYHKVMELLDFVALNSIMLFQKELVTDKDMQKLLEQEIVRQTDKMEADEKISSQWKQAVSLRKLNEFCRGSLAKRMARAAEQNKLYKEQPFVLGLPANRVKESFPETEMVLMQGIIDVYFEEEDGIVVADYKTDRVQSAEELIRRYYLQLDYYAEALERLTGKPVKEKIIYSFALGEEIALS